MKSASLRFKVKFEEDGNVKICKVTELRFNKYGVSYIYYMDAGEKKAVAAIREDVVLLMYSTFSDKHSIRICDGDIIKKERRDGTRDVVAVKFNTGNGFVVYDPECCTECKYGNGCIETLEYFILGEERRIEILGNIYKNYDILTGEKKQWQENLG